MDKIIAFLTPYADKLGVPVDKLAHFLAGMVISALALLIVAPLYASMLALAAGVAKEFYDVLVRKQEADPFDAWMTGVGGSWIPIAVSVFA